MALWTYKVKQDPRQHPPKDWIFVVMRNGAAAHVSDRYPTAKAAGTAAKQFFEAAQG